MLLYLLFGAFMFLLVYLNWPTKNGFGYRTTGEEVSKGINLEGKVAIVTGSNTGLGLETARLFIQKKNLHFKNFRVLCLRGAHVIMACRSEKKMIKAMEEIKETNKKAKITCIEMDLGSLQSINTFVKKFEKMNLPLHILVANAGITGMIKIVTNTDI